MSESPWIVPGYDDADVIGRGAFAVAYRARQIRLNRPVAVKVLLPDLDADEVRRFEQECVVLGQLGAHTNIVDTYDAGVTSEGRPYIVMKLYTRGSLADRLRAERSLSVDDVVGIVGQIAPALDAAHRSGVIHRDVKPENVLVGDRGEPVLADFGVAAVADASGRYTTSMAYSRGHVAPEVLDRNTFGVASDVYAIGSLAYTMLAGRSPFAAETEARQIVAIMQDPAPSIGRADVSPALEHVIANAMNKDPAARPSSASLLAQQIAAAAVPPGEATSTVDALPELASVAVPAPTVVRHVSARPAPASDSTRIAPRRAVDRCGAAGYSRDGSLRRHGWFVALVAVVAVAIVVAAGVAIGHRGGSTAATATAPSSSAGGSTSAATRAALKTRVSAILGARNDAIAQALADGGDYDAYLAGAAVSDRNAATRLSALRYPSAAATAEGALVTALRDEANCDRDTSCPTSTSNYLRQLISDDVHALEQAV